MTDHPGPRRLLAVIVAAYNVGMFIEQALLSVVSQTGFDLHIQLIVVFDGSTDETESVVTRFIDQHPWINISIINQKNMGLSAARNAGLQKVATEYVTFLDGDDFWLPNYLQQVLPRLSNSRYDIVEYDALLTDESGRPYSTLRVSSGPRYKDQRITKEDFASTYRAYSWARAFRTELVKRKPFPPGLRYEDAHTTPWYYDFAQEILSLGQPLLAYRQRRHSIVAAPIFEDVSSLNRAAMDALARHKDTGDSYWSAIAMRIFQQVFARVIVLPFRLWPSAVRQTRLAMASGLEPGPNPIRVLQVKWPFTYVALLYLKRNTMDEIATWRKKWLRRRKLSYWLRRITQGQDTHES